RRAAGGMVWRGAVAGGGEQVGQGGREGGAGGQQIPGLGQHSRLDAGSQPDHRFGLAARAGVCAPRNAQLPQDPRLHMAQGIWGPWSQGGHATGRKLGADQRKPWAREDLEEAGVTAHRSPESGERLATSRRGLLAAVWTFQAPSRTMSSVGRRRELAVVQQVMAAVGFRPVARRTGPTKMHKLIVVVGLLVIA